MNGQGEERCLFCGNHAKFSNDCQVPDGTTIACFSYRCNNCGQYVVEEKAHHRLRSDKTDRPFRIACLLKEMRLRGNTKVLGLVEDATTYEGMTITKLLPVVGLDEVLSDFPNATEIIDRALLNLSRLMTHPMEWMTRPFAELQFLMFCPEFHLPTQVEYMRAMGFLQTASEAAEHVRFSITPQGWQRIDALSKSGPDSKQAFVAMWFDEQTDHFFSEGFVPGLKDAGYKARRIDNKEHNNKICDEIVAEIRKSRFVVADFTAGCCKKCETCEEHMTCRDTVRQRGGVYFEAGFALGLGIPVIWTVRKDQIEHIHFDTRQYSYIVYENAEELRQKLRNRIAVTIH